MKLLNLSKKWIGGKSGISGLPLLLVVIMLSCQINSSTKPAGEEESRDGLFGKYYSDGCTRDASPNSLGVKSLILRKDYTYSLKFHSRCYPADSIAYYVVTQNGKFEMRDTSRCIRRTLFGELRPLCGTLRFYPDGAPQWEVPFDFYDGSNSLWLWNRGYPAPPIFEYAFIVWKPY